MYHQVLYQVADKISNTLQNNRIDPVLTVIGVFVASVILGTAAYLIQDVLEQNKEIKKYKTA